MNTLSVGWFNLASSEPLRARLANARREGRSAIAIMGDDWAFSTLYRPQLDTIVNPWDRRSARWSPLAEMKRAEDSDRIAAILIPNGRDESGARFAAQLLLAGALEQIWRERGTHADLLQLLTGPQWKLHAALSGHEAEEIFSLRLRDHLMPALTTAIEVAATLIEFGEDIGAETGWSFSTWAENQRADLKAGRPGGVLWITAFHEHKDPENTVLAWLMPCAFHPWLAADMKSAPDFLIWSLDRMPRIENLLCLLAQKASPIFASLSSISEFFKRYPGDEGRAILAGFPTIIARRTIPETAEWFAEHLNLQSPALHIEPKDLTWVDFSEPDTFYIRQDYTAPIEGPTTAGEPALPEEIENPADPFVSRGRRWMTRAELVEIARRCTAVGL